MFASVRSMAAVMLLLLLVGCSPTDQHAEGTPQQEAKSGDQAGAVNGKSESDSVDAPPVVQDNGQRSATESAGRRLTQWVLEKGGTVSAYVDGKPIKWDRNVELPEGNIEPFRIQLEGATIRDEEMARFAGQPRLRDLYLNQSTVTDKGLKHLQDLPQLEALQLGGTQITDEGVAYFAQIPSVKQLYLQSTKVGDRGLRRIGALPGLTVLWLADTPVSDAGLVHVGRMESLITLNLQDTGITDEGLKELSELTSLNHCDVRNTKVTPAAAEALDRQLENGTVSYE